MFEFSVALKYLIPKRKQLSLSLISLMSVGVISLVVWLLLLFLSITEGIEKSWLEKLTALNAPLRINPTPAYFNSYYYQIDSISEASGFLHKSLGEKGGAKTSDPYSVETDMEIPSYWPSADKNSDGSIKDPVKKAFEILKTKGLTFQDYEISGALMRLQLIRPKLQMGLQAQSNLTQASYIATFAENSPYVRALINPPTDEDLNNLFYLASLHTPSLDPLLKKIDIKTLKTSGSYRQFPQELIPENSSGVFLAKSYQENGVKIGDRGHLSYTAPTASSLQEQRIPIHVSGFYDPGIMAVGNKCILAPASVVRTINVSSSSSHLDRSESNGIHVWFPDVQDAAKIKKELAAAFKEAGIENYWKITTFHEYDFAKDLMQQFQSDRYLFAIIGIIILTVACCNIISLLVLLVNDKKKEIGILQTLGASTKSIAAIFGLCGAAMGILSSLIGIGAAFLTLHNIDSVVHLLSMLQGHDAFNAAFYGKSLPDALSQSALLFILIATPILSLFAGLVPAIKACRLHPSAILRSE